MAMSGSADHNQQRRLLQDRLRGQAGYAGTGGLANALADAGYSASTHNDEREAPAISFATDAVASDSVPTADRRAGYPPLSAAGSPGLWASERAAGRALERAGGRSSASGSRRPSGSGRPGSGRPGSSGAASVSSTTATSKSAAGSTSVPRTGASPSPEPTEADVLCSEFLALVQTRTQEGYEGALALCDRILELEPRNKMVVEYQAVLARFLKNMNDRVADAEQAPAEDLQSESDASSEAEESESDEAENAG